MKAVIAVGLVLIALGLPTAVYYASYFLTLNSTISPRFSPDMETRFQLTEALGASLAFLGAVLVVGGDDSYTKKKNSSAITFAT